MRLLYSLKLKVSLERENWTGNNIEKENYEYEIIHGMYRDMNKINEGYIKRGIDVDKI